MKDAKFCSNCGSALPKADEVEETVAVEEKPLEDETVNEPVEEVEETVEEESVEEESVDEPVEDVAEEVEVEETIEVNKNSRFCSNCGTEVSPETVFCPQCGFKLIGEEKPQTKFCQNCGKKIDINAELCPHCGVRVANFRAFEEKNVLIAAILSFLFPGLGHLYLGLNTKGISFIIAYIVSAVLALLLIGAVLMIIVWLWALVDSIKSTEAINRGEFVEDKLF